MAVNSRNPFYIIPNTLPDEVLYSRIIRFSILNGLSKSQTFIKIFGKRKVVINTQLPSYIKKISNFGFGSCRDLIFNQSLFLYFSNLNPQQRKNLYRSMCKEKGANTTKLSLLANIKCNQDYNIKFCPYCYQEDIEQYGIAYWHLSHQIPYQILCPLHFIKLESLPARTFNLPILKDKNTKILKCDLDSMAIGHLMQYTLMLARTNFILNNNEFNISSELERLGYKTKKGRYKRKAIMNGILDYYHKSIQYLPLHLSDIKRIDFFNSIFHLSRKQRNFSHIKLLLILNWIKNYKHKSNRISATKKDRKPIIKKIKKINIKKLDSLIIIKGITGEHRNSIANAFNIPVHKVDQALSLYREVINIRKSIWRNQRRLKYRFRVLTFLLGTTNPSIKSLKYNLNKEYYWLYIFDTEWLKNHQPKKNTSTLF